MTNNPFPSPSTSAVAWANGFFNGFSGPDHSVAPPADMADRDADAFNAGVLAGQQAAIDGLEFSDPCVPAAEEGSEAAHVITGVEILHGAWELRHLKSLGAGLAGIAVALFELACSLPKNTRPPEEVLPNLIQPLLDSLEAFGVGSLELFCGAGLDPLQADCEIRLTPLFRSLGQARDAATAMGRPKWAVVSWRTDQCRSFRVVDAS
jgi:hypothetical protein